MNTYKIELKRGFKNGNVNDTATFDIVIYDVESEKKARLICETGWAIAAHAWDNDQPWSATLRAIEMEAKLMGGYTKQIMHAYSKCIEFIAHPEWF